MSRARAKPETSRKHLARAQRDRIQSRWVFGVAIVIGVTVIGLIAFAILGVNFIEARQPIVTINGEDVTIRQFKARVRLMQFSMINEYQYSQSILQLYADEPSISVYYQQRLEQLASELDNPGLQGQRALEELMNEVLLRQEANARGIFVNREDIDPIVAEQDFNYYAQGTPTPQPSSTPRPSATTDPAVQTAITPSATPEDEVAATATSNPTATVGVAATPTSSPTPLPTATAYTEDAFLVEYADRMTFFEELGILEEDYLALFESGLYRERLLDALDQEFSMEEDQVWLRHILVADADQARIALERFENGEAWEDLAAELSQDVSTQSEGGDLGWHGRTEINRDYGEAFGIIAFASPMGEVAGPFQTVSGWHIIQLMGHEVRIMTDVEFEQRVQAEFDALVSGLFNQAEIEIDEKWLNYVPHASELASQVVPD